YRKLAFRTNTIRRFASVISSSCYSGQRSGSIRRRSSRLRSDSSNAWMLSVNSAFVTLYGYLETDKLSVPTGQKTVWLWAVPAVGVLVCIAWGALLTSYRQLNRAKFVVLSEIEADLPLQPFTREREAYMRDRRLSLTYIETAIPGCF